MHVVVFKDGDVNTCLNIDYAYAYGGRNGKSANKSIRKILNTDWITMASHFMSVISCIAAKLLNLEFVYNDIMI